ncbi:J domain-containing protein [Budvicia diplopodorum]|uniref:J domain-containing protein n=1 Tax=Budvicia diplopodorum TaxID=1119056 RepID=UPI00135C56B2|nr:J domain-containing protein [Budvicia diplopodorum]
MNANCWEMLGIEPTDDQDIIRNAYRSKLPEYHPESDPQGFQNLRQAYEEAKKGIQPAFIPVSALTPKEEFEQKLRGQSDRASEEEDGKDDGPHPEQEAIDRMLAEFDTLQQTADKRYSPHGWHEYIQSLDLNSFEVIDRLRWRLLEKCYNTDCISRQCSLILADRMRWKQRLSELSDQQSHRMGSYLDFLEKGDVFNFELLSDFDLVAQTECVKHINFIQYLYWEKPAWMLKAYLQIDTAVYWPDVPELKELLPRWYSYAGLGYSELADYCLKRLADEPDSNDWLYLYASQCSLAGNDEYALPYWIRLYTKEQHAAAEEWLISWCHKNSPERLPLLIQAFDRPQYTPAQGVNLDAPEQNYITPTQTTKTLTRWGFASQAGLPQLAQDYVSWKLSNAMQYRILRHLIKDNGSDRLLRYYRHASMLTLGNETLLQQILDEKRPSDPLNALILKGLKHQAQQRLDWLQTSSVISTFTTWLYERHWGTLPDIYGDRDSDAYRQCLLWLAQRRWMSPKELERLYNSELFSNSLDICYDWLCFIALNNNTLLPTPNEQEDYWQWCRRCYLLVLLLEKPAESIEMIHQTEDLTMPQEHPAYVFYQLVKSLNPTHGDLASQYMEKLQLSNILQYHSWTRLPITPENFLDSEQVTISYSIDHFFLTSQSWRETVWAASKSSQMLFYAASAYHGINSRTERFTQLISEIEPDTVQESELKKWLLNTKPFALAKPPGSPTQQVLARAIVSLHANEHRTLSASQKAELEACMGDQHQDIVLRLAAKMMLLTSASRSKNPMNSSGGPSKVWEFWRLNSRLNRSGFAAQLILGSLVSFILAYVMSRSNSAVSGQILLLACLTINALSAQMRRLNDLNYGVTVLVGMSGLALVNIVFPPAILWLLFKKGVPHATKAGPPTSRWFNRS